MSSVPVQAQNAAVTSRKTSGKLTLQLQGIDVVEVLKILAEQAGFNLVAGRNVTGQVTLFVREVDPWEALEVILTANELAYEQKGKILTIMTRRDYEVLHGRPYEDRRILKSFTPRFAKAADLSQVLSQVKSTIGRVIADQSTNTLILMDTPALVDEMIRLGQEMDRPLHTQVFSLNYGIVADLAPLLEKEITDGMGTLSVDERTNQVVVTDYPPKLEKIAKMIKAFDEKTAQVLIETKILQIKLTDQFQLGIDWEALVRENITVKGLGALSLTSGGSVNIAQAAISDTGDYRVLIEALRTYGDTEILSEPRLTVVNNQEGKILVGSKEPYVTQSSSQGQTSVVTSETVTFLDVGVELFVTPTITRDGFIQMKVAPKISSRTGTLTTADGNAIPIIETAEAETTLMVEDGGTVILGGLIQDTDIKDQKRIPILGDIPLVGLLFRSTDNTVKKTEIVIILTARIVSGRQSEKLQVAGQAATVGDEADYYLLVRDLVQAVASTQPLPGGVGGKVVVRFTLSSDGRLKGGIKVVSSPNKALNRLASRAVRTASIFPSFPLHFEEQAKVFTVPISYEE